MPLLRHMRVSRQITLFVLVLAAVLVGTAAVGLMTLKSAMIEDRKATLSRLVDTAVGLAENWRAEELAGRMTREQAQAAAIQQLRALRFGPERDYYFIQGYDGMSILNPGSPQLEGKLRLDGVDADGVPNIRLQIEAARQPQGGFVFYRFPRRQGEAPIQKLSFSKGIDAWQWAVCTGIYLDDVDAAWESEALRIGVPLLIAIAVLLAGALIVSKGIAGPLSRLVDTLAQLSSGNRTIEIEDTDRRNEIGALARSVSDFKEALLLAERLDQEKRAADAEQARRHDHLARITRSFGDNMDTVAKALTTAAAHLTDRAKRLADEAQVTLSRADTVRTASSVASNTAVTIASSTEQMTSSISEIGRSMTEASRVAQAAVVETEGAQLRMTSLSAAVKKIGEIVGLVNSIAAQTNLLALNATIEAARAGEAGKGFAVVASEVKNLASQTTRATEEISAQITEIQDETGHFVSIISRITETIGTIGRVTVSVAAQIEQQEAGAAEISQALSHASTSAADIDAGILDVTKEAEAARSDAAIVLAAAEDVAGHSSQLGQSVKSFLGDLEAA